MDVNTMLCLDMCMLATDPWELTWDTYPGTRNRFRFMLSIVLFLRNYLAWNGSDLGVPTALVSEPYWL